ncbi:hypothetical protein [Paraburkholderia nodosa]|uniref:hypothetical protein n=1 Tax=Paraburkholderia nodosa TaxID=392320 RepID=UPI0004BB2682|nr:hypothetical protein [Paraburkholderia nodosa]
MIKLLSRLTPVAIVLAASLGFTTAKAADSQPGADNAVVAKAPVPTEQPVPGVAPLQAQHGLTRRDVYNQLIQAEKDGTLDKLNATIYYGS